MDIEIRRHILRIRASLLDDSQIHMRHADLRGVLAGDDPSARGRTARCRGIGLGKAHPLLGKLYQIGRLVRAGITQIIQLHILPAEIIDVKNHDVWFFKHGPRPRLNTM